MNYNRIVSPATEHALIVICDDEEGNFLQIPTSFAKMFSLTVQQAELECKDGVLYVSAITDDADCAFACGEFQYREEAAEQGIDEYLFLREIVNCVLDEALCHEAVQSLTNALLAAGELGVTVAVNHYSPA